MCDLYFLNEKFMQKSVNVLDSQNIKFVFGDGPITVAHCPPKNKFRVLRCTTTNQINYHES